VQKIPPAEPAIPHLLNPLQALISCKKTLWKPVCDLNLKVCGILFWPYRLWRAGRDQGRDIKKNYLFDFTTTNYGICIFSTLRNPLIGIKFGFQKFLFGRQKSPSMKDKNRLLILGLFLLFTCTVFGYGIAVGHLHWPPFDTLLRLKIIPVVQPIKITAGHSSQTDSNIIYKRLYDNTEYDVILLAGQSNMVGEGNIVDLDKDQHQLPANIDYYNFGRGYNLNYDLYEFGPEIGLSHKLYSRFPEKNFVLIKYAVDGASLLDWSSEWTSERAAITGNARFGALYQQFLEKIRRITGGKNIKFIALLWMQGETDARIPEVAEAYYENFVKFVENLRRDLDVPNLPILLGKINPPAENFQAVEVVRDAQKRAAKTVKNVWLIETDGISKWDDNFHYSSQGQLELGKRFAHVLEGIIAAQVTAPGG